MYSSLKRLTRFASQYVLIHWQWKSVKLNHRTACLPHSPPSLQRHPYPLSHTIHCLRSSQFPTSLPHRSPRITIGSRAVTTSIVSIVKAIITGGLALSTRSVITDLLQYMNLHERLPNSCMCPDKRNCQIARRNGTFDLQRCRTIHCISCQLFLFSLDELSFLS